MSSQMQYRIFHSGATPLACLSGSALLIMASDRLAHAITVAGALVWVYCLSSMTARTGASFFPRRGRTVLLAFLTSFFAGIYLVLLWMLSPLCAMESFFVISLIPMFCMVSGIFKQLETLNLEDTFSASCSEALILGTLVIIFSLIREPFGFLSLSLPGGSHGIVLLFSFKTESFLPIRLIASSAGALLLLGYFLGLYRYFRAQYGLQEGENDF
ncbi:MAG: hypothetical protein LBH20_10035 [Treponema sp.]|jgi:hypothetical protein|nr:hypothetical protein [Treponema sp.]